MPEIAAGIGSAAPRVVMDTNVLYAGLYSARGHSHRLLHAVAEGRVRIVLSTPLLFEYEEVLRRHQAVLALCDAEIEALLDNLCALAEHQRIHFLWRPSLPDAKDDMVLELAVAAQAGCIVTFNTRDFGPAVRFGIEVLRPNELLERLS
jgi:putative PIN family toxin of toxin-antitoxin system